jgi:hypothetical protein
MDVAPIESLGVPVLSPVFGFSAITAPEVQVEMHQIQEGNWEYARKVVKAANVGPITLQRGATFFDGDFYRWITATIAGDTEYFQSGTYGLSQSLAAGSDITSTGGFLATGFGAIGGMFGFPRIGGPSPRRDLLLIQFFANEPVDFGGGAFETVVRSSLVATASVANIGLGSIASVGLGGLTGKMSRLPARAWQLHGCLPTRYKTGTDFDARSGEVSIMELEIEVEHFNELSLGV